MMSFQKNKNMTKKEKKYIMYIYIQLHSQNLLSEGVEINLNGPQEVNRNCSTIVLVNGWYFKGTIYNIS